MARALHIRAYVLRALAIAVLIRGSLRRCVLKQKA